MTQQETDSNMINYYEDLALFSKVLGLSEMEAKYQWPLDVYAENQDLKGVIDEKEREKQELQEIIDELQAESYLGRGAY